MADSIRIKRGLKSQLPKSLPLGELAYCTDTSELYVGTGESVKKVVDTELKDEFDVIKNETVPIIDNKVCALYHSVNHKVNEIATKGTTQELIREATRNEIEKQIEDGTISSLTIQNSTVTEPKLSTDVVAKLNSKMSANLLSPERYTDITLGEPFTVNSPTRLNYHIYTKILEPTSWDTPTLIKREDLTLHIHNNGSKKSINYDFGYLINMPSISNQYGTYLDSKDNLVKSNVLYKKFTGEEVIKRENRWDSSNHIAFGYTYTTEDNIPTNVQRTKSVSNCLPYTNKIAEDVEAYTLSTGLNNNNNVGIVFKLRKDRFKVIDGISEVEEFKNKLRTLANQGNHILFIMESELCTINTHTQNLDLKILQGDICLSSEHPERVKIEYIDPKVSISDVQNCVTINREFSNTTPTILNIELPYCTPTEGLLQLSTPNPTLDNQLYNIRSKNEYRIEDIINGATLDKYSTTKLTKLSNTSLEIKGYTGKSGHSSLKFYLNLKPMTTYYLGYKAVKQLINHNSGGIAIFNNSGGRIDKGNHLSLGGDTLFTTDSTGRTQFNIYISFASKQDELQTIILNDFHINESDKKVEYTPYLNEYIVIKRGDTKSREIYAPKNSVITSLKGSEPNLTLHLIKRTPKFNTINSKDLNVINGDLNINKEFDLVQDAYTKLSTQLPYQIDSDCNNIRVKLTTNTQKGNLKVSTPNVFSFNNLISPVTNSEGLTSEIDYTLGSSITLTLDKEYTSWPQRYSEVLIKLQPGKTYTLFAKPIKISGQDYPRIALFNKKDMSNIKTLVANARYSYSMKHTFTVSSSYDGVISMRFYITGMNGTQVGSKSALKDIYLVEGNVEGLNYDFTPYFTKNIPLHPNFDEFISLPKQSIISVEGNSDITNVQVLRGIDTDKVIYSINNQKPDKLGNVTLPTSRHYGKNYVAFGDSITGNMNKPYDYPTVIGNILGLNVVNAGFGGCRWGKHANGWDAFSMYQLSKSIQSKDWTLQRNNLQGRTEYFKDTLDELEKVDWDKVDLITIAYGTNDWGNNKVGDPEDEFDVTYIKGAIRQSLKVLMTTCPKAKIGIITPMYRWFTDGDNKDSDNTTRGDDYLIQVVDSIIEVAQELKVPVLDNYRTLGLNKYNKSYWFNSNDGTHPNANGSKLLGEKIAGFIESQM